MPKNLVFGIILGLFCLSFSAFAVEANFVDEEFSSAQVGTEYITGSVDIHSDVISLSGCGADVWGTSDAFYYFYKEITGDCDLVVKVDSLIKTHSWAKVGLGLRESLDSNAKAVSLCLTPNYGVRSQFRSTTGGKTSAYPCGRYLESVWLRVVRQGNVFTSYTSLDGSNWSENAVESIPMEETIKVGLISCSHNTNELTTANFSFFNVFTPVDSDLDGLKDYDEINLYNTNPEISDADLAVYPETLPYGLIGQDIGACKVAGSSSYSAESKQLNMTASGYDIWGSGDSFHYTCKDLSDNGEIIARLSDIIGANTGGQSRAGLMIRETVNPNSKHVMFMFKEKGEAGFYYRSETGSSTTTRNSESELPLLMRLRRDGNRFTASTSDDGISWTQVDECEVEMSSDAKIGLILCSVNATTLSSATFDSLFVTNSYDSDGDTLSDYDELTIWGTDPNNGDIDEDGVLDPDEIANNTDPYVNNGGAPLGWMFAKIGSVTEDSIISYNEGNDSFELNIKSHDVWYKNDNFGYAYKNLSGDFSATVKVESIDCGHYWGKACLMVRSNAESKAAYSSVLVSKSKGVAVQYRGDVESNAATDYYISDFSAPYWLRVIRKGTSVTHYISHDGNYWVELSSTEIAVDNKVKVGLAVCSGLKNTFADVKFSNVTVKPLNDMDEDGLSDIEEEMITSSMVSPDTDMDWTDDLPEIDSGTSVIIAPTEIDGKVYHKTGLIGRFYFGKFDKMPDFESLPVNNAFFRDSASFDLGWNRLSEQIGNGIVAMTLKSMIYIPNDGNYTFYTNSDDGSQLFIDGKLIVENDGSHGMREHSGTIELTSGLHEFELQYYQAGGAAGLWTSWEGPELAKQVIPTAAFVYAEEDLTATLKEIDQDGDGLTDEKEAELGSDPLKVDSNGDGLTDPEKYALGLDLIKDDTDGDGVSDFDEINTFYTNPLAVEFDGTEDVLEVVNGSEATIIKGDWQKDGNSIYSIGRNGTVEYKINLPEDGIFVLRISGEQNNSLSEHSEFTIDLYTDTSYTGRNVLDIAKGNSIDFALPLLGSGTHTVKLDWRNVLSRTSLKIDTIEVIKIGGPDSDNDGVLDWQQYRLDNFIGFKKGTVTESFVSPFCIEGKAIYLENLSLTGSYAPVNNNYLVNDDGTVNIPSYDGISSLVEQSWFANAPLSPVDATTFTANFQNGAKEATHTVKWKSINLLQEVDQEFEEATISSITIRTGDSLLLTAQNECKSKAAVTISVDQETYSLEFIPGKAAGQSKEEIVNDYVTKIADHLIYTFNEAGTYSVTATFDPEGNGNGKELINGRTLTVNVVSSKFSKEPVCFIDSVRIWDNPELHSDSVLEFGYGLYIQEFDLEPTGKSLKVVSDSTDKKRVLARLYENGPITDVQNIKTVNHYYAASEAEIELIQTFPDGSDMIQFYIVVEDVPDDLEIKVHIFVGGITFDDGTVTKVFTADDFNEYGELRYNLIRSREAVSGNCHWVKYFQDDSRIY